MARLTSLTGIATLTYNASNFFDELQLENITDPSSGFVEYVDAATAKAKSLAGIRNVDDEGYSIWFFPHASIPADITAGTPDPSTWGKPLTYFVDSGGCDFATYFKSNRFIFCGWAGAVWSSFPQCSAKAATCKEYASPYRGGKLDYSAGRFYRPTAPLWTMW
ncbi:hypothetical protein VC83_01276 [Pseudogymnoascus destructans]|uniref:Uncharacterized protein n=1 Tax=Pseudogymnoascus destructans TaxID=655981 RepID=A0A177AM73_9PEZI|nr:uncharacterized protein VC83_01276 [Pseudogymnoascus destructans]OAF62421.1 hypothetical protein VC83_01276 [Pseudogymnoascus destructans]